MEALRTDEIVGAQAKHLHLRMELGAAGSLPFSPCIVLSLPPSLSPLFVLWALTTPHALSICCHPMAEMMLEQELEKMTTEELKRIIEEGDLEWNEGVCADEVDHEHNNNTNGGSDHALLSSHADVEMRGQTSGGAAWPVAAGEESEAKLKRETARDIVYFVQTQGFEGIAEEEWDSDELDEIEELKKEIDRIQEELKFQRYPSYTPATWTVIVCVRACVLCSRLSSQLDVLCGEGS
jgi:hypothetical protein